MIIFSASSFWNFGPYLQYAYVIAFQCIRLKFCSHLHKEVLFYIFFGELKLSMFFNYFLDYFSDFPTIFENPIQQFDRHIHSSSCNEIQSPLSLQLLACRRFPSIADLSEVASFLLVFPLSYTTLSFETPGGSHPPPLHWRRWRNTENGRG